MRKLLNVLYVMTPENYLSLDGENVVVSKGKIEVARIPLHTLEGIVTFTYAGASPALMGACGQRGIEYHAYSPQGKYYGTFIGEERGNVLLRIKQYEIAGNKKESCLIARNFILGKIFNTKWVLERATRDHPQRIPVSKFKEISANLDNQMRTIRECTDLDTLRGIEGEAAQRYFGVFNEMILQQKDDFVFKSRNRRPPLDSVNATLSFGYSILTNECGGALKAVGLDPYVGFLHRLKPGRKSMALDLVEELRPILADRFALSLINQKMINKDCFEKQDSGAVLLNERGRRIYLQNWQKRKQEELTHPFLGEKISWGLVPYVQALLFARALRGDLDEYPPFLWK